MGIYIKNMEMPTSCYDCPLAMQYYVTLFGKTFNQTKNDYACVLTHKKITSTRRNRFCPLIHVPPHGRLIDADALEYHCDNVRDPTGRIEKTVMWSKIEAAPTVIQHWRVSDD